MRSQTFSFTDKDLKEAAELACEAWYKALPRLEDCVPYSFSDSFKTNMDLLIKEVKRHEKVVLFSRRFVAALIALLIGLSLWLTVDTDARAVVRNWFREVFGTTVLYHYTDNAEITELPNYELSYIPEGFEEIDRLEEPDILSLLYVNPDTEDAIQFECYLFSETLSMQIFYEDHLYQEKIKINDISGDYYAADETSQTNTLVWFDETGQIVFILNSNLEKDVILHMAEGVNLVKTQK